MRLKISTLVILFLPLFIIASINNAAVAEDSAASMIKIPGGKFKSGPDGQSREVKTFYIDKHEVTNAEFKKFQKEFEFEQGNANLPVVEISYASAEEYCKSVGKKLPTALQWEKAARGTDGRIYPWGNDFDPQKANTQESSKESPVAVGSYPEGKSPYGAMDMCGNVWEWVDGWESEDKRYRIVMGGSFFDDQNKCTAFSTLKSIEDDIHTYLGFRCAKDGK